MACSNSSQKPIRARGSLAGVADSAFLLSSPSTPMIVRIFVARVFPGHQTEFERKFREISLPLVRAQRGLVSVVVGRPVPSSPGRLVGDFNVEGRGRAPGFCGARLRRRAVIPAGMEQHMRESRVHHYEVIE